MNTEHGTHVFLYIKLVKLAFCKSPKIIKTMKPENYTQATQIENEVATSIHQSKHFPFIIVQQNDLYKIAVGTNLVTENTFTSIEEAEEYLNCKPWDVIVNFVCATYNMFKQNENESK